MSKHNWIFTFFFTFTYRKKVLHALGNAETHSNKNLMFICSIYSNVILSGKFTTSTQSLKSLSHIHHNSELSLPAI